MADVCGTLCYYITNYTLSPVDRRIMKCNMINYIIIMQYVRYCLHYVDIFFVYVKTFIVQMPCVLSLRKTYFGNFCVAFGSHKNHRK